MRPPLVLPIALPLVAALAQWIFWPWITPYVWLLFYPAVFFSARYAGLRGGIFSSLLSVCIVAVFFIPMRAQGVAPTSHVWSVVVFLFVGALMSETFERLRHAQAAALGGFEAAFDQAAAGMALMKEDGTLFRVNQKYCGIVGYDQKELLGKRVTEIIDPADLPAALSRRNALLAGQAVSATMEKRYVRKNGEVVWVKTAVSLVRMPEGEPDCVIAVVEDIHERKMAELALRETSAILADAQEVAGLGNWHVDLRTKEAVWSATHYRVCDRDPALGPMAYPEILSLFTPESQKVMTAGREKAFAGADFWEGDLELARPDGVPRWVTVRSRVERDASGAAVKTHGVIQDITERKRAEQEARAARAALEAALASMSDGVCITDVEGRPIMVNDAFARLQKFKSGAERSTQFAAYKELLEIFTEDGEPRPRDEWAIPMAIRGESAADVVRLIRRKDTGESWLGSYNYGPIRDCDGGIVGAVITGRDIAASREAERALRTSQERLAEAQRVAGIGDYEWDPKTGVSHWSPRIYQLFNRDPALGPITYQEAESFFEPSCWIGVNAAVEKCVSTGEPFEVDAELKPREGAVGWVSMRGEAVRDGSDALVKLVGTVQDVTARKAVEAVLRESEARLKIGGEVAGLALGEIDYDTGVCHLSSAAASMFGLGEATKDLPRERIHALFHPEDRAEVMQAIAECLDPAGAGLLEAEHRIIRQNGETRWLRVRKQVFFEGEGAQRRGVRSILAAFDITTEKRALEATRHSEEFLRGVLDSLPDEIAVLDGEGVIATVNERWVRFGVENHARPQSVSSGANYLEVCRIAAEKGDVDAHKALQGLEALLAGAKSSFAMEYPCHTIKGVEWFAMHAARSVHASTAIVVNHTNITDRRNAEVALSESEGRLRLFIEHAPAALAMFDREMRYIAVSQRWKEDYAFGTQDVMGRSHYDLFPDLPERWRSAHLRGLAGEIVSSDEDRFDRDDGSVIWQRWEVRPWRTGDGGIGGIIIFSEDITKLKSASEEVSRLNAVLEKRVLERTAQLVEARGRAEAANEAKSAFLANMSHEIRTPMNAILGFTRLLLNEATSPQQAERLAHVHRAGQHLLSVINDILDISKIEAGHLELARRDFDLGQVLADVASLVSGGAREKGLRVDIDTDDMPARVFGDDTRLRQALLNYANNAVKFTEKGCITLRVRLLEQHEDEILAKFEVQDSGVGVDPESLPRLFNAFEQADASTTRHHGGTGLGLAITRRLAEHMGGEAGAVSAPGAGSTFWFTARLARAGSGKAEAGSSRADGASRPRLRAGARILLAEDNAINRQVAVELLSGFGLCVETACDGREALEMAKAHAYDLVLMDVQMPEVDGIAATRALRALPAWSAKPIVALSANVFEEDRTACAEAGMNDFVGKPIDPDVLYRTLGKWLPAEENAAHVAQSAPESAIARLQSIPGLDSEQGLRRVNDNLSSYRRLLRRFVADHPADVARIQESLGRGDRTAAAHAAHDLRGVAGNLGAFKVESGAASIEAALKAEASVAEIEALTLVLDKELHSLAFAIGPTIAQDDIAAAPIRAPDGTAVQRILDELESALVDNDVRANEIFEASATRLTPALGLYKEKIERQIDDYQYEQALHILRQCRDEKTI